MWIELCAYILPVEVCAQFGRFSIKDQMVSASWVQRPSWVTERKNTSLTNSLRYKLHIKAPGYKESITNNCLIVYQLLLGELSLKLVVSLIQ